MDDYLYHYTDARAVLGILSNRKLWATDHEYLNDGLEAALVPRVLKQMVTEPRIYGTQYASERQRQVVAAHLCRGMIFHVASFSRRPDMLTQFRMYCPPRGGFVIGFPREFLERACKQDRASALEEVNYDRASLVEWCKEFFRRYTTKAAELDDGIMDIDALSDNVERTGPWLHERCRASIRCKSSEFATEEEVRLLKWHTLGTHYRPSASGNLFIPYVELELPNEPVNVHVAAGPGPMIGLASQSIGHLTSVCRQAGSEWMIHTSGAAEYGFRDF